MSCCPTVEVCEPHAGGSVDVQSEHLPHFLLLKHAGYQGQNDANLKFNFSEAINNLLSSPGGEHTDFRSVRLCFLLLLICSFHLLASAVLLQRRAPLPPVPLPAKVTLTWLSTNTERKLWKNQKLELHMMKEIFLKNGLLCNDFPLACVIFTRRYSSVPKRRESVSKKVKTQWMRRTSGHVEEPVANAAVGSSISVQLGPIDLRDGNKKGTSAWWRQTDLRPAVFASSSQRLYLQSWCF